MTSADAAAAATIELEGHIIDSLLLAKVLDEILADGADYTIVDVAIGRARADFSRATLAVSHAGGPEALDALCARLAVHGAQRVTDG